LESEKIVSVAAPCRLHFGMVSFGGGGRQFGGVGVMVDRPGLELRISLADRLCTCGPLAGRVGEFARRWALFQSRGEEPNCRIEVVASPRLHVGLGVGTQLGLSVAAGLNALLARPPTCTEELAQSVGRGLRSSVGAYGFVQGGLIADRGKLPREPLAPLDCRLDVPPQWRFLLIRPRRGRGLWGETERRAFAELPAVPVDSARRLRREVHDRMLPAAERGAFEDFSESVYRFGRLAGLCFAQKQGGPYNGPHLCRLVERIRSLGVRGVGQSSWGPTLFAVLPDNQMAGALARELARQVGDADIELQIAAPQNVGARVIVKPAG
jgi:beta-RFAP synthase